MPDAKGLESVPNIKPEFAQCVADLTAGFKRQIANPETAAQFTQEAKDLINDPARLPGVLAEACETMDRQARTYRQQSGPKM